MTPARDSVYVHMREPLSMRIFASADSICLGDSVYITAVFRGGLDTNYTYYWGHDSVWKDTIAVVPSTSTTYYLYLFDSCSNIPAVDSYTVFIREPLKINLVSNVDTACEGEEVS